MDNKILQGKELEEKIKQVVAELFEEQEFCEKNGHVERKGYSHIASGSNTGTRVYTTCERCGMMYERGLTSEEWNEFNKLMNTPMTI